MKDLKNIIYAIIFSTIGGVVSISGYNYMYPRNNTVAEINNDKIKFANYIYDTTDVVVPEGLNFIYTSKKTTPAVVHIRTTYEGRTSSMRRNPFEDMFRTDLKLEIFIITKSDNIIFFIFF